MIVAHVIFGSRRNEAADEQKDVAESYLAALLHSGQICGEYFLTWNKRVLNAYVRFAGPDAFELRHHSTFGEKELQRVVAAFGQRPVWEVLDDNSERPMAAWMGAPFLYLFTQALDCASPLSRGDERGAIPLYTFPISFELKEKLFAWQRSYCHLDNIWLKSGALETIAYRQLAGPTSELAERGRKLCREVETATGVPTFYYLMRYWGSAKAEEKRVCPGCGAEWRVAIERNESAPFWKFGFRCDSCRLVSHIGVSTDGGRRTRIGEFREK